ncbi:hypothetical protein Anacy_3997 [Anabaena cylindrica PCC 7122]|uniref:Uncharacterized protein n=1 Tax=Anabaena cylindrica (strain ATCC 27899 / PCC 7122) TaxID=272123 RepID=K9ZJG0_ANACC|nr:hypothetical protein Anacy_3997 [Anabaena cylindrica PCC 7122]BAY03593.1 hypothetical protein NIES19_28470 [Anabaena cylindrica PCC 7122]
MIVTDVGWVVERKRIPAGHYVNAEQWDENQHFKTLWMLGFTLFNPTYASIAFFY